MSLLLFLSLWGSLQLHLSLSFRTVCSQQKCAKEEEAKSFEDDSFQGGWIKVPNGPRWHALLQWLQLYPQGSQSSQQIWLCVSPKTKTSEEVGKSLLCILATSIMPRILQSDNGGEVHFCNLFSIIITIFFLLQKPFRSYHFFRLFLWKNHIDDMVFLPFIFRLWILLLHDFNICLVLRLLYKIDQQGIPLGAHSERETPQAFNARKCRSES